MELLQKILHYPLLITIGLCRFHTICIAHHKRVDSDISLNVINWNGSCMLIWLCDAMMNVHIVLDLFTLLYELLFSAFLRLLPNFSNKKAFNELHIFTVPTLNLLRAYFFWNIGPTTTKLLYVKSSTLDCIAVLIKYHCRNRPVDSVNSQYNLTIYIFSLKIS